MTNPPLVPCAARIEPDFEYKRIFMNGCDSVIQKPAAAAAAVKAKTI